MFVGFVEPPLEREDEGPGSGSGGIRDIAKPWRQQSRIQKTKHQTGAEGNDLRRDVDTDRWEGESSKWARGFSL